MNRQSELFAAPMIDGLAYFEDMVTIEQERALLERLSAAEIEPFRFQGWLGKRLTASFGWRYDFDDSSFAASVPLPDWLLDVRAAAASFAGLIAADLVQAMVTRYDPGAGIGWHRDRPLFDQVIGISLGAPAVLRLRRRTPGGFERRSLPLAPRSAYRLAGEVRSDWEHSIAPMTATRWSITFRSLSDKGRIASGAAAR